MDFMTTEYVKQEAAKGTLPALKCSLKHHEQGRDADWVELKDAIMGDSFHLGPQLCACCQKVEGNKCPLDSTGCGVQHCCGGKFQMTVKTLNTLQGDYSNANFKAFQEAEAELCEYIEGKIEAEEAKECKCKALDKPELRHGDYGNKFTPWVYLHDKLYWLPRGNNKDSFTPDHTDFIEYVLGNLADDLAAISEPLEEFTRKDLAGNDFNSFGFTANNETIDYHGEKYVSLGMDEIKVLTLNLRRMEATLKSK